MNTSNTIEQIIPDKIKHEPVTKPGSFVISPDYILFRNLEHITIDNQVTYWSADVVIKKFENESFDIKNVGKLNIFYKDRNTNEECKVWIPRRTIKDLLERHHTLLQDLYQNQEGWQFEDNFPGSNIRYRLEFLEERVTEKLKEWNHTFIAAPEKDYWRAKTIFASPLQSLTRNEQKYFGTKEFFA